MRVLRLRIPNTAFNNGFVKYATVDILLLQNKHKKYQFTLKNVEKCKKMLSGSFNGRN